VFFPANLSPGLSLSLCVYQRKRTGGRAALKRINIWIVVIVLITLWAVTWLVRHEQDRIASVPMNRAPRCAGGELYLERHFLVVYLDQRGTGRSFDRTADPGRLSRL
jgi:pimeloyl-ACP methyl ester carboxylesterase